MKEYIIRFISPTPAFFVKWQFRGGAMIGYRGTLALIDGVPDKVLYIATIIAVVGATIVLLSQFVCTTPPENK